MTTITCDVCDTTINGDYAKITVWDGQHPHNSSTMYREIDVCPKCASYMKLESRVEFEDIRAAIRSLRKIDG